jgi:hypothetical protein
LSLPNNSQCLNDQDPNNTYSPLSNLRLKMLSEKLSHTIRYRADRQQGPYLFTALHMPSWTTRNQNVGTETNPYVKQGRPNPQYELVALDHRISHIIVGSQKSESEYRTNTNQPSHRTQTMIWTCFSAHISSAHTTHSTCNCEKLRSSKHRTNPNPTINETGLPSES